jgi:F-type H+-transporting ATPase subunit delta
MSVATSYAKAFYEVAKESQATSEALDSMEKQLELFLAVMDESKEARTALQAPVTTTREKTALVEEISKKLNLADLTRHFLMLLARKDRISILREVRDAFNVVRLTAEGGVPGRLIAAESMSEADISTLAKAFSQKLGKKVAFRVSTDSSLLAGMKVTVNGVTYDGTLRSQLQKLRDRFVAGFPGAHA